MSLRDILLQIAQVVTVIALAPLLQGFVLQWEERIQRSRGPGFFSRIGIFRYQEPLAASFMLAVLAIGSLLLAFVVLGSRWLKDYLLAFTAESWLIALLSCTVGHSGNYHEWYFIAVLTAACRGMLLTYLIWWIIVHLEVERELHVVRPPQVWAS